jgi:vacuolar-type H+-ATPase catalytic subunit A/Vma1
MVHLQHERNVAKINKLLTKATELKVATNTKKDYLEENSNDEKDNYELYKRTFDMNLIELM